MADHVGGGDDIVEEREHVDHLVLPLREHVLAELERLWDVLLEEVGVEGVDDLW